MPCEINDSNILPPSPPAGISGFGPIQPELPFELPEVPLEFLQDIFNALSMALPGGNVLKPGTSDNFSRDIGDGILSILEKFMPFLYLYNFFIPILNLIICIIEVLCSLNNPFKLRRAIRRLFRRCLPDFLSLFPSLAIIAMLLSLLALIIALIEYILQQLAKIINTLLINIRILSKATKRLDSDSILAITKKIGQLLCILQNILTILLYLGILVDAIKAILRLTFRIPPCSSSGATDDDCCTPDVCPSFIKNNEEIIRSTGTLKYLNMVGIDASSILPPFFPAGSFVTTTRAESLQFFDLESPEALRFNNIIHPFDLDPSVQRVFFPPGVIYDSTTDYRNVEYTTDLRLFYNPTDFGRSDILGARYVRINNCIVSKQPYDGYYTYDNSLSPVSNGTVILVGGLAFEDDETTPILIDGVQANINTLIHLPALTSDSINPPLSPSDGYTFEDVQYVFRINHESLLRDALITLGCMPDVAFDKDFINTAISNIVSTNSALLANLINDPNFPDINATNACINTALAKLNLEISEDSINTFNTEVTNCLNNLKNSSIITIGNVINIGFDASKSSYTIDPTIQFIKRPITVNVILNDGNGISMVNSLNSTTANDLASRITGEVTLGELSDFTYDGYGKFVSEITSLEPGNGEIRISFDNQVFTILNNPDSIDESPSITDNVLTYTFVGIGNENTGRIRYDESDTSRDIR